MSQRVVSSGERVSPTGPSAAGSGRRAAASRADRPQDPQTGEGVARMHITYVEAESDYCEATWARGDRVRSVEGSRAEVLAWAREHRADEYYLFDPKVERYVRVAADRLS